MDAVVEGISIYIEDRGNSQENGDVLDYIRANTSAFDNVDDEINLYFNELEEELDNPDDTTVQSVVNTSEDETALVLTVNLDVTENEPEAEEDSVQDLADSLQVTAPVSDSAALLAVLNRLGLSVDKKNRILAIVGE